MASKKRSPVHKSTDGQDRLAINLFELAPPQIAGFADRVLVAQETEYLELQFWESSSLGHPSIPVARVRLGPEIAVEFLADLATDFIRELRATVGSETEAAYVVKDVGPVFSSPALASNFVLLARTGSLGELKFYWVGPNSVASVLRAGRQKPEVIPLLTLQCPTMLVLQLAETIEGQRDRLTMQGERYRRPK